VTYSLLLRSILPVVLLLGLPACNKGSGAQKPASQPAPTADITGQPASPALEGPGYAVYMATGCKACHGEDLAGSGTLGPPLKGISANWNADTLRAYLKDPQAYAHSDPRLAAEQQKYTMRMPAMPLNETDMGVLVGFLLEH
jgi:cytochrome c5